MYGLEQTDETVSAAALLADGSLQPLPARPWRGGCSSTSGSHRQKTVPSSFGVHPGCLAARSFELLTSAVA